MSPSPTPPLPAPTQPRSPAAMAALVALGRLATRLGSSAAAAAAAAAPAAAAATLAGRRRYSAEAVESWEAMRQGFSSIQAEVEGGVAVLTLARPEALNALNKQARSALAFPAWWMRCGLPPS